MRPAPVARTGYAAAVDDRDGEAFAELFVADGELVGARRPAATSLRSSPGRATTRSGGCPTGSHRYHRTFHRSPTAGYEVDGDTGHRRGLVRGPPRRPRTGPTRSAPSRREPTPSGSSVTSTTTGARARAGGSSDASSICPWVEERPVRPDRSPSLTPRLEVRRTGGLRGRAPAAEAAVRRSGRPGGSAGCRRPAPSRGRPSRWSGWRRRSG